jgi:hypothetical protein
VVAPENFPRPGSTAKPLSDHIPLGGFVHFTNHGAAGIFDVDKKWRALGPRTPAPAVFFRVVQDTKSGG